MTEQQQELAREIAETILKGIKPRFEGLEKRFAGIESGFEGLEGRLTTHVDKQLAGAVAELKHQAQVDKEELKDDVKKAAEGYDATLRKIERELSHLNEQVDNGFRDHALAIKNHSNQISELQKRR